jgi:hypothetical protein
MGRLARHTLGSRVSERCTWSESSRQFSTSGCTWSGGSNHNTVGLPCGPQGVDEYGTPCTERVRLPRTWEYTVGAEREVVQGVAVGSDFIYRLYTFPYTTGETNRIWNQSGTEIERTGGYRNGRNETINNLSTPPNAERTYKGITTSVRKREGKLKIHIAYTWSHLYGNVWDNEGSYGFGQIPAKDQFLYGDLPSDHRHSVNTTLNYQLWKWMTIGVAHSYHSGAPYDRKYRNVTTGGRDDLRARVGYNPGGNINDPGDDRPARLPDQMRANVMVRMNLKPLTGIQLEPFVDVMNILALRTTTSVVEDDGPRYGAPSGRAGPLWIRLGARYKY